MADEQQNTGSTTDGESLEDTAAGQSTTETPDNGPEDSKDTKKKKKGVLIFSRESAVSFVFINRCTKEFYSII